MAGVVPSYLPTTWLRRAEPVATADTPPVLQLCAAPMWCVELYTVAAACAVTKEAAGDEVLTFTEQRGFGATDDALLPPDFRAGFLAEFAPGLAPVLVIRPPPAPTAPVVIDVVGKRETGRCFGVPN